MGSALSPLRSLLITLSYRLLQIPWLLTRATFRLLRRCALWASFLFKTRFIRKKDGRKPKDDSEPPISEVARLKGAQCDLKFAAMPSGDTVSHNNGVAHSLYPFSSHGIDVASPVGNHSPRNSNEIPEREPYLPLRPQSLCNAPSDHSRSSSAIGLTEASDDAPAIHHGRSASRASVSTAGSTSMHSDAVSDSLAIARSNNKDTHTITPCVPEDTKRYTRRTKILTEYHTIELDPLTTSFDMPAPPGWAVYVHPEGCRYFYHPEMRIYTDSDLYDPRIFDQLMNDALRLEQLIHILNKHLPEKAGLMIDVDYDDYATKSELKTQYYYVDHDNQVVFFAHKYDSLDMHTTWETNGTVSPYHFGLELRSQYWFFVLLYPNSISLTSKMVSELRDIVVHQIGDLMTSPYSTAPFTREDLFQILTLTDGIEKNTGPNEGTVNMIARYMYIFYHSKFINFYGETCARISRDFSVFGNPLHKKTWLVKSLSIFLFSAPDVHLHNIRQARIDGIMHRTIWEETTKQLNEEWQQFIFFSTVMLTTNVGYLAIQSVDIDQGSLRSIGQIASYLSVVANIGSIILGLLLMRQHRTNSIQTPEAVTIFLGRQNYSSLRLETLAILYSLPYALLMWGVVAFLAAFSCICFEDSSTSSRILVGLLSGAVAILVVWCITISWDIQQQEEEVHHPLADFDQLKLEKRKLNESAASSHSPKTFKRVLTKLIGKLPNIANVTSLPRPSVDNKETAV